VEAAVPATTTSDVSAASRASATTSSPAWNVTMRGATPKAANAAAMSSASPGVVVPPAEGLTSTVMGRVSCRRRRRRRRTHVRSWHSSAD